MRNKKENMQKYIDEFSEWQDNQYNPGHWIGGIVPNNLLSPRKPAIVGVGLILIALSVLAGFIFMLIDYLGNHSPQLLIEHILAIARLVLVGAFAVLLLIGGIQKVAKNRGGKK